MKDTTLITSIFLPITSEPKTTHTNILTTQGFVSAGEMNTGITSTVIAGQRSFLFFQAPTMAEAAIENKQKLCIP